jgi:sulfatase modifying factor 1
MPCSHIPPARAADTLRVEDRWLTETVLALARGVAADVAFDRLPILADALEDAGCDNARLLKHLRHEKRHAVGCWALRRLLRTTLLLPGGVPMAFAYCPPGSFLMGNADPHAPPEERPQHRVTLTTGFYAGIHTVTQGQWRAVMNTSPSAFSVRSDLMPVERVSWEDAQKFCRRAGELVARPLRLPTEAEWEYACRAGTSTAFHYGDRPKLDLMTCHMTPDGYGRRMLPVDVGKLPPNPWGLFDTHGNVREWCADWYDEGYYHVSPATDPTGPNRGRYRVCRGGCWFDLPPACCSHSRGMFEPDRRSRYHGFRVVFTAG